MRQNQDILSNSQVDLQPTSLSNNKEKDIKNTIDLEIKHFMGDRRLYKGAVGIKTTIAQVLDDFWKAHDKLKAQYGTKALYSTGVS